VDKPLRVLSGGERTRFRLAQTLFSPANLLLLDEPTNHLDVTSRSTVEEALKAYTGTVIVVSHDRVFMDRVTDRIVEIENGVVRAYPGKYGDYLAFKQRLLSDDKSPAPDASNRNSESKTSEKQKRIEDWEQRKAAANLQKSLQRKIEDLEQEIENNEAKQAEVVRKMADPKVAANYSRLGPLSDERSQLIADHHQLFEQWESLHGELERLGVQP